MVGKVHWHSPLVAARLPQELLELQPASVCVGGGEGGGGEEGEGWEGRRRERGKGGGGREGRGNIIIE